MILHTPDLTIVLDNNHIITSFATCLANAFEEELLKYVPDIINLAN